MALYVAQVAINATVAEDVLLSVAFSCPGVPTIEWRHASHKGAQRIVAWQPGTQANVAPSHQHRICTFDNGSLQLLQVGPQDAGVYVVTVSEQLIGSSLGTIALHVSGEWPWMSKTRLRGALGAGPRRAMVSPQRSSMKTCTSWLWC